MVDIFPGISAFTGMLGAAKSLKDINDSAVRNEASIGLQGRILEAQEAYGMLLRKVEELEAKVKAFDDWEMKKQQFQPVTFDPGVTVYVIKPGLPGAEHGHHYCAQCFANRKPRILQATDNIVYRRRIRVCKECRSEHGYGTQEAVRRQFQAITDD